MHANEMPVTRVLRPSVIAISINHMFHGPLPPLLGTNDKLQSEGARRVAMVDALIAERRAAAVEAVLDFTVLPKP